MTSSTDCVFVMFDELRTQRPPIYDADAWQAWLSVVGQTIAALPTQTQRWAATVLIADDLVRAMPGLLLPMAYTTVLEAVLKETHATDL